MIRPLAPCLLALAVLALSGCGEPLPPDKILYAGDWAGGPISLRITLGGRVEYEKNEGGMNTSIEAPIQEFVGDDFVVGFLGIETTFVVSDPPHEIDGVWHMTVDGVALIRVATP